jgi:transposase InsO family protein
VQHGNRTHHKRKDIATTNSNRGLPVGPNLLAHNFSAKALNRVWMTDITYLTITAGRVYLTLIIDLFRRQVVSWLTQPNMKTELVTDALRMAYFRRRPEARVIVHSDRSNQYCSLFQDMLKSLWCAFVDEPTRQLSGNAPTGSLWRSLKVARVHGRRFAAQHATMDEVIDWVGFGVLAGYTRNSTASGPWRSGRTC